MLERFEIRPMGDGSWQLLERPLGRTVNHGNFFSSEEAKVAADNLSRGSIKYQPKETK